MNAETLGVLIPVIAVGGFFMWRIVVAFTGAYTARLNAPGQGAAPESGRVAALEEQVNLLHGQVSELAERLDFAERLLAERRERKLSEGPHGNL